MAEIDPPGGQNGVDFGSGGGQNDPRRVKIGPWRSKLNPMAKIDPPGGQNDPQNSPFWHPTVKIELFWGWV